MTKITKHIMIKLSYTNKFVFIKYYNIILYIKQKLSLSTNYKNNNNYKKSKQIV